MIYYVCKYTPVELLAGFDQPVSVLEEIPESLDGAEGAAHPNLCGFGKAVIQAVLSGKVKELVLVNCCDAIRRAYDVIEHSGKCDFLFLMDLPHDRGGCGRQRLVKEMQRLQKAYADYSGRDWDFEKFRQAFTEKPKSHQPYLGILGARVGKALEAEMARRLPYPVENLTCTGSRRLDWKPETPDAELWEAYGAHLLGQLPCQRMGDPAGRRPLYCDPDLVGIVYHTIQFCDYYGFEYEDIRRETQLPLLKLQSDYTMQSQGQLLTRLEAFAESLTGVKPKEKGIHMQKHYGAGVDSGSSSTDTVIVNEAGEICASVILPTGAGAQAGAEKALEQALQQAGLKREDLRRVVTTGYGRSHIRQSDESITEITCHARGAYHLNPKVRTIIDIGGQDSKVIRLDEKGQVKNFVMNDKCAAGTGRFLEMMARTLGLSLEEMSRIGLHWHKKVTISSMCTVFAESEVVSLIAQNQAVEDIVHGLNDSVAAKTASLVSRTGLEEVCMMTGGVAKNQGVVQALEERLGVSLYVREEAQLCGALGAALFALE
jgi:predicted CoA-substrate-specific enzyme activase